MRVKFRIINFILVTIAIVLSESLIETTNHYTDGNSNVYDGVSTDDLYELKCSSYKSSKTHNTLDVQKYKKIKQISLDNCFYNELVVQRYGLFEIIIAKKNDILSSIAHLKDYVNRLDCRDKLFNASPEVQSIISECKDRENMTDKLDTLKSNLESYLLIKQTNHQVFENLRGVTPETINKAKTNISALLLLYDASKNICEKRSFVHTKKDYIRVQPVKQITKLLEDQVLIIESAVQSASVMCRLFEQKIIQDIPNEILQIENEKFVQDYEFNKKFSDAYKRYILKYEQDFIRTNRSSSNSHTGKFSEAKELFTDKLKTQREMLQNTIKDFDRIYRITYDLKDSTFSSINSLIYSSKKSHVDVDFSEIEDTMKSIEKRLYDMKWKTIALKISTIGKSLDELETKITNYNLINNQRSTIFPYYVQQYQQAYAILERLAASATDSSIVFDSSVKKSWTIFVTSLQNKLNGVSVLSYKDSQNQCEEEYSQIKILYSKISQDLTQLLYDMLKCNSELNAEIVCLRDSYHDHIYDTIGNVKNKKQSLYQDIKTNIQMKFTATRSVVVYSLAKIQRGLKVMNYTLEQIVKSTAIEKHKLTNEFNQFKLQSKDFNIIKTSETNLSNGFDMIENENKEIIRDMGYLNNTALNLQNVMNIIQSYCTSLSDWNRVENCYRNIKIFDNHYQSIDITIDESNYLILIQFLEDKMNNIPVTFSNIERYFLGEIPFLNFFSNEVTKLVVSQKNLENSLNYKHSHLTRKVDIIRQIAFKPFIKTEETPITVTISDANILDKINSVKNLLDLKKGSIERDIERKRQAGTSLVNQNIEIVEQWKNDILQKLKDINGKSNKLRQTATQFNSFILPATQLEINKYYSQLKNYTIQLDLLTHSLNTYKTKYAMYVDVESVKIYNVIKKILDEVSALSLRAIQVNSVIRNKTVNINDINNKVTEILNSVNNIPEEIPPHDITIPNIDEFKLDYNNEYDRKVVLIDETINSIKQSNAISEKIVTKTFAENTMTNNVNLTEKKMEEVFDENNIPKDNTELEPITSSPSTREVPINIQNNPSQDQPINPMDLYGNGDGISSDVGHNFGSSHSWESWQIYGLPIAAIGLISGIVIVATRISRKKNISSVNLDLNRQYS